MKEKQLQRTPISVVIPTCERKHRLLAVLRNLDQSTLLPEEVIIVDSGNDRLVPAEYAAFPNLRIQSVQAPRSVCIQRNTGIRLAASPWIFLCDDDIEFSPGYLQSLADHLDRNPEAGAVSGQWLQKLDEQWKATYPVHSPWTLLWKFLFQLGIWGEINCHSKNRIIRKIKRYYKNQGNHISKAGWPVNIDFTGDYSCCPVYSLGASLVKKEWLIRSPYDEILDPHGIGDNYGVIINFPNPVVHVLNGVAVYHHHEPANRLKQAVRYYRRILALDYFRRSGPSLQQVNRYRLAWALTGNLLGFVWARDRSMIQAGTKALVKILFGKNPYWEGKKQNRQIVEPLL